MNFINAQNPKPFTAGFKYSSGFSKILLNGKFGYIDKEGALAIPCVFDYTNDFVNNYAIARNGKKLWYYQHKWLTGC